MACSIFRKPPRMAACPVPLKGRSTRVIRRLSDALDGAIPIIGVGGITRGGDAWKSSTPVRRWCRFTAV